MLNTSIPVLPGILLQQGVCSVRSCSVPFQEAAANELHVRACGSAAAPQPAAQLEDHIMQLEY